MGENDTANIPFYGLVLRFLFWRALFWAKKCEIRELQICFKVSHFAGSARDALIAASSELRKLLIKAAFFFGGNSYRHTDYDCGSL